METFPKELKYSQTHEWVMRESDTTVVIGVTDHAQHLLGELVFIEMPESGLSVTAGDEICVLESVKAAADVFTPISGLIVAVNEDLEDAPGLVNSDPYQDGWLYKIELKDPVEYDELLDSEGYQEFISEED